MMTFFLQIKHTVNKKMGEEEEVSNTQIIFNGYIDGFPTESAMTVKASTIKLKVPNSCSDAVLVKTLYLSCDPYMRSRMSKIDDNYIPIFTPGLVWLMASLPCSFMILKSFYYIYKSID